MRTRTASFILLVSVVIGAVAVLAILPVARPGGHQGGAGVLASAFADDSDTPASSAEAPLDAPDENQVQKAKPILSLGSGLRVGVALVTGPASQVDKVKVVAQVEGNFKGARIRAFVPIETESLRELHRVPETSIAGVADIKL
jgi:hypothetical protein